jgi:hypothetical protein
MQTLFYPSILIKSLHPDSNPGNPLILKIPILSFAGSMKYLHYQLGIISDSCIHSFLNKRSDRRDDSELFGSSQYSEYSGNFQTDANAALLPFHSSMHTRKMPCSEAN